MYWIFNGFEPVFKMIIEVFRFVLVKKSGTIVPIIHPTSFNICVYFTSIFDA